MTELINRTVQFLKKTLHTNVKISGSPEISRVPFLFRENYNFFRINLEKFGQIVLVIDQKKRKITPAVIQKEMESISENLKKMSVYVNDVMDFNKRDRLIKYNVPFIVPGKQIYIPGAGLSLTENYQPAKRKTDYLSPSSVCVINYIINQSSVIKTFPLRMLSANLGYSAMTISRSFDELRNFGLIAVNRTAREVIGIAELLPVTILEKTLPFLKPVVKDIVYLKVQNNDLGKYVLVSGITALSEYTDLNAGKIKSYAGNSKLLKMILEKKWLMKLSSRKMQVRSFRSGGINLLRVLVNTQILLTLPGYVFSSGITKMKECRLHLIRLRNYYEHYLWFTASIK